MNTPAPNPARFDGHILRLPEMAVLAGMPKESLRYLARKGRLPAGSVVRTLGGHRRFDAGKVLAWQQQRQQERR